MDDRRLLAAFFFSSPLMGEVARSAGVGDCSDLRCHPLSHAAARHDSSPIKGEQGLTRRIARAPPGV